jgi:hypothetical protein
MSGRPARICSVRHNRNPAVRVDAFVASATAVCIASPTRVSARPNRDGCRQLRRSTSPASPSDWYRCRSRLILLAVTRRPDATNSAALACSRCVKDVTAGSNPARGAAPAGASGGNP